MSCSARFSRFAAFFRISLNLAAALGGFGVLGGIVAADSAFAACQSPSAFPAWLQSFKQDALAQGISQRTVHAALDGLAYDPAVIAKDRGQRVFAQTFLQFSGRMVAPYRLKRGAAYLRKDAALFARIKREFGVPGPVLVAYWGLETDFGANIGHGPTLRSLATLAFDCRRGPKFRSELMYALRIIDRGDLTPSEMRGPWAGELGQTQFLPSVYYKYCVDYDHNGRCDLLHSAADALASTANYLDHLGWHAGQPWLQEVQVPAKLPWQLADITVKRPRAFWAKLGVTQANGRPLPQDNLPASLLLPMGRNGPAFLAYPNFDVYLAWNQSLVYSTTAAYFATRLAGAPPLKKGRGPIEPLSMAQARLLQQILVRRGYDVGKIDGVIGEKTRQAVRDVQLKLGFPADSYPTPELLTALQRKR